MNIPKNVQEYISSLPPNQQKAAINEIMRSQYSAYKNSPNQVNQQNMAKPIITKNQELTLPSKFTEEENQEQGNLEMDLQSMLIQYFEKMQFTEAQAKQFMQEFAKLSDEEKQQVVQELQQELQGNTEEQQEMPEEEMQEPQQQQYAEQQQGQTMKTGGFRNYMNSKKNSMKYQTAGKKPTMDDVVSNINNVSKDIGELPTSTSKPATVVPTNTSNNKKQVIKLDNRYVEVDVDKDNKPMFGTARVLSDSEKANMNDRYVFQTPITTTNPTTNTQASSGNINEGMVTNAEGMSGTKISTSKAITKPKTQATSAKKSAVTANDNSILPNNYGLTRNEGKEVQNIINKHYAQNSKINVDGKIGSNTIAALKGIAPALSQEEKQVIESKLSGMMSGMGQQSTPKSGITPDTSGAKPDSSKAGRNSSYSVTVSDAGKTGTKPKQLDLNKWLDEFQTDANVIGTGLTVGGAGASLIPGGQVVGVPAMAAGEAISLGNGLVSLGRAGYAYFNDDKSDDDEVLGYLGDGVVNLSPYGFGKAFKYYKKAADVEKAVVKKAANNSTKMTKEQADRYILDEIARKKAVQQSKEMIPINPNTASKTPTMVLPTKNTANTAKKKLSPTARDMAKKIKANNSVKKQFGGNLGYWF